MVSSCSVDFADWSVLGWLLACSVTFGTLVRAAPASSGDDGTRPARWGARPRTPMVAG
ncbi:hypothetical protein GCM10025782_05030 [Pedococcus ginsenosidimutans]|uniref:Uncharacterized protein n=1 Tax=Pedococcus ginsenosidimutans TaxID=490570 RepID=A0ABP8XPU8_9MICO